MLLFKALLAAADRHTNVQNFTSRILSKFLRRTGARLTFPGYASIYEKEHIDICTARGRNPGVLHLEPGHSAPHTSIETMRTFALTTTLGAAAAFSPQGQNPLQPNYAPAAAASATNPGCHASSLDAAAPEPV